MTSIVSKNLANTAKLRHFLVPRVVVPRSMLSNMLQIDCDDNPVIDDFSVRIRGIANVKEFQRPGVHGNGLKRQKIWTTGQYDDSEEARRPMALLCHFAVCSVATVSFFIQAPAPGRRVRHGDFPSGRASSLPAGIVPVVRDRRSHPSGDSGP
nr:hypothetical protein [uncultured Rhodopila sp.]